MKNSIMVKGKKRVCVIYDNGGATIDRYTVVLKAYRYPDGELEYPYLACSEHPFNSFGQHGWSKESIRGPNLGKRVAFDNVPKEVQEFIIQEFNWNT